MDRKIKGQDKALGILEQAISKNKLAGSYLFYGPAGVGKFTSALTFAQAINCVATKEKRPCGVCVSCRKIANFSHPDLLHIFPFPKPDGNKADISLQGEIRTEKLLQEFEAYIENKIKTPWKNFFFSKNSGIRIASIRMLEHRIRLSPNEAAKKIYIVENAEEMTHQAANAFLKTLEEPPDDSVIILTSSKPNSLLPTILSRCQKIPFQALTPQVIEEELSQRRFLSEVQARLYSRIAGGSMAKALRLADDEIADTRVTALELITIISDRDDLKFLEFCGKYGSKKNQALLREIIVQLIIWQGDLNYLQYYPEATVNQDQRELLEKYCQLNPTALEKTPQLLEFLELMLEKISGHVNPQLILINLYNRLAY
jgi:DNA polymerase-3 subunit delta'